MRGLLLVLVAFARIFAENVEDYGNVEKEAMVSKELFDEFYTCLCDGDHQECLMYLSSDGDDLSVNGVERFGQLDNSNSDCKYFTCSIAIRDQTPALVCSQEMNATTACDSGLKPQFIQLETLLCCSSTCVGLFWNNVDDKLLFDDPDLGVGNCSTECACPDTLGEKTGVPDDDESPKDPITLTAEAFSESTSYSPYSTSQTSTDFSTNKSTTESPPFVSNSTSSAFPKMESTISPALDSSSIISFNFSTAISSTESSTRDINSLINTSSLPNEIPYNKTTYNIPGSTTSSVTEQDAGNLPIFLRFTNNTALNYFILVAIVLLPVVVVGLLVLYTVKRAWKRRTMRQSGNIIDRVELEHLNPKHQHV